MKTLCFIPARGGSVRVPRKNIRMFHGKPIIQYSIENAQKCGLFDQIVVSTDDLEIASVAYSCGAVCATRGLAGMMDDGSTGTQELAGTYLRNNLDVGICCVLYATAPLLGWRDLVDGYRALIWPGDHVYAYSAVPPEEDHMEWNPPPAWTDIGGYYWGMAQAFRDAVPLAGNAFEVEIEPEKACDINTEEDFAKAESMYLALRRANGD